MKADAFLNRREPRANPLWSIAPLIALACLGLVASSGCYAPLISHGIPARELPDDFRIPRRTGGAELNFAALSIPPQHDYILGPGDVLEVTVNGLYPNEIMRPVRAQVMGSGEVHLPMVEAVYVADMNVMQAHAAINEAFADGFINDPRTSVYLVEKATTNVLVMGDVNMPGMYSLPKYENDVAHALAAAGGPAEDAALEIEVHRRIAPRGVMPSAQRQPKTKEPPSATIRVVNSSDLVTALPQLTQVSHQIPEPLQLPNPLQMQEVFARQDMRIVKIPLRGYPDQAVFTDDIVLNTGDVVIVPSRKDEVFYIVGRLSATNFVRFSIGKRERDIGAGFLLPRERDIDVVTAVAMAGYIDPIDSPTTVTVHRHYPGGRSLLIHVDLIKARYDYKETVLVEPGDIVYLNPDVAWWSRRTLDRIIVSLFTLSYGKLLDSN